MILPILTLTDLIWFICAYMIYIYMGDEFKAY